MIGARVAIKRLVGAARFLRRRVTVVTPLNAVIRPDRFVRPFSTLMKLLRVLFQTVNND